MLNVSTQPVDWGTDAMASLDHFVQERIDELVRIHLNYHQNITKYKKWYRGTPNTEVKDFPWTNASNVIIQLIGTQVDTLVARTMGMIYEVSPLWSLILLGKHDGNAAADDKMRRVFEQFMDYLALEPGELDLYRNEQLWFADTFKFGFKVVKVVPSKKTQQVALGPSEFVEQIISEGPEVINIDPSDFMADPNYTFLDDCPFKVHRCRLTKDQMLERFSTGFFNKASKDIVLATPDDRGFTLSEEQSNDSLGISPPQSTTNAHWHVYECWLDYYHNGKNFSLVYFYHKATRTQLRVIYNFLPNNMSPFVEAKLGYRTEELYGFGFAEMLYHYQEEVTAKHNRRNDNATLSNIKAFWADPANTKLGRNIKIYPGAIIPAGQNQFGTVDMGNPYPSTISDEELLLQEAQDRSGIGPAVAGLGGGTMSKKGIYSSMGTMAAMEDGNRRVNLNIMDVRYAHASLGRKILKILSSFGVGKEKIKAFGKEEHLLRMAIASLQDGRLVIPIKSATGMATRELKRQNDLLLFNTLRQHYMSVNQLLQTLSNPALVSNNVVKDYMTKVVASMDLLMEDILRNFGFDDPSRFVPKPLIQEQQEQQNPQAQQAQLGEQDGTAARLSAIPRFLGNLPQPNGGTTSVPGIPTAMPVANTTLDANH